jgi:putative membrane protein
MNAKDRKKYYYFLAGIFAFIWMFYQFNQLTKFKILSIDFSNMLFPSIGHIPLFIGLVWITGILISAAFVYTIGMARGDLRLSSLLMGLIMVIYNFLMDPAAQKIGIWNWFDDKISFENYIVWFLFGSIIGFIGFKINLFDKIKSKWLIHLAIAQIIGFSLAQLK